MLHIFDGLRTPFARMGTSLASLKATDLAVSVTKSLIAKTAIDPTAINHVIFGCVAQPADAPNLARVIALRSGIPKSIPAYTVQRNCASGLEAITQAYDKLSAKQGELFLVGGVESMTHIPLLYRHATAKKFGKLLRAKTFAERLSALLKFRPHDFKPIVGLELGLSDPVANLNMGQTAEILAKEFEISREEQDKFALESHQKAAKAQKNGNLAEEIAPIFLNGKHIENDNGIRPDSNLEKLAKLKAIFDRKFGSVTAGNSSQITDGAVALLVGSKKNGEKLGLKPLGKLTSYAWAGCEPERMGLGPAFAIDKLIDKNKNKIDVSQADIIEINEAFASQVLAVKKIMANPKKIGQTKNQIKISNKQLNPQGGAIALGHPVGATGARLVLTALKQLNRIKRNGKKSALVSLCIGGGQGGAVWLET